MFCSGSPRNQTLISNSKIQCNVKQDSERKRNETITGWAVTSSTHEDAACRILSSHAKFNENPFGHSPHALRARTDGRTDGQAPQNTDTWQQLLDRISVQLRRLSDDHDCG